MQGVVDPSTEKGIIPRAFEHIFESIQDERQMTCTRISADFMDSHLRSLRSGSLYSKCVE